MAWARSFGRIVENIQRIKIFGSSGFRVGNRVVFFLPRTRSAWLEACQVTSNRVHGIMILVGAGHALPNQASDPEKGAASSAPTIQIPH